MKFFTRKRNDRILLKTVMTAFFAVVMAATCVASGIAQESVVGLTARGVFTSLQCRQLEILKKTTRLDMLDYWDADSIALVRNAMDGLSKLENVENDYLKVLLTPVSTFEIKILPVKKGFIAMTVYTVGDSVQSKDSQVEFYDSNLSRVNASDYLSVPDLKCFFDIPKGSATKMSEISEIIPFPTIEYTAQPASNELKAKLTVENFIPVDDWNVIRLFLKPEITADWKGKYRFK